MLALALGAPIIDAPELQNQLVSLLQPQDEQTRADKSTALHSVLLDALLFFCHDNERRTTVRVGELTEACNVLLKARGESLELEARKVGSLLRSVGLFTSRLDNAGRGILLLEADRRRIHRLARDYDIPSIQDGVDRCSLCAELRENADQQSAATETRITTNRQYVKHVEGSKLLAR